MYTDDILTVYYASQVFHMMNNKNKTEKYKFNINMKRREKDSKSSVSFVYPGDFQNPV